MGLDDEIILSSDQDQNFQATQLGDALRIDIDNSGKHRSTLSGPGGVRSTFFRVDESVPTIILPDIEQKYGVVKRFIGELTSSPIPLMLKTKSKIGDLGEELYLGFNARPATVSDQSESVGGEVLSAINFCIYAKGNGVMIPSGKFGLIGHRDIVLARDNEGEFIYTDKKLPVSDYLPSENARWDLWKDNMSTFDNTRTIERWRPDGFDPYNAGLGSLMQGSAVAWFLEYGNANRIKTGILLEEGIRTWRHYGLDTSSGIFNRAMAINQINDDVFDHVR